MRRAALLITALLATTLSFGVAQQPVTSPIYYLTTAPRLEVNAPVAGVLSEASGRNFKDGSYLDVLTLSGEAGEFVEISASSSAFDTYLTLFAPDGSLVDYNDDDFMGFTTDSAIRTTLPMSGTYVIVVSGYGPWDVGPYTVTLTRGATGGAGSATTLIDVPSLQSAQLGLASEARFSIELSEVTALAIEARSTAFDTTLELLDEYGYSLAYNDDAPSLSYTTDSALVALLAPGRYTVVVQPYFFDDVGDGSFELEVRPLVHAP